MDGIRHQVRASTGFDGPRGSDDRPALHLVPVRDPQRRDHHGGDVGETEDRGPGQFDVPSLELGVERAERCEQRPQHEHVASHSESHRVGHSEPGQERDVRQAHSVADVVDPVQDSGPSDPHSWAEPVIEP